MIWTIEKEHVLNINKKTKSLSHVAKLLKLDFNNICFN